jgi:multidrug efflux system membrane fusion protein
MAARRRSFWIFVILGILAVAIVAWVLLHRKPAPPPGKPPTPVEVAVAQTQDVQVTVDALGAAQAWRSDTILSQVTGKILSVPFKEGAFVKAGQLLAQIDPAPYRAALLQAQGALKRDEALLAEAKVDLARYETLAAQDSVAKQTRDTQAALVKQDQGIVLMDQGAVAAAKVNLDFTRIVSPISGRAGVRLVDPGNIVTANAASTSSSNQATQSTAGASGITGTSSSSSGTGIVMVNQIEPIAVTFTVPQGDFQRLSEASDAFRKPLVTVALSQETGQRLGTGELTIADNRVDPATGTVTLKARFPNQDHRLWPGQFVNVQLTLQTLSRVVTVPTGAVNQGPHGAYAYVVGADRKAVMRPLKLGPTEGPVTVVQSGVSAGETVVVDGQMTLKAGAVVRTAPPARSAAASPAAAGRAS